MELDVLGAWATGYPHTGNMYLTVDNLAAGPYGFSFTIYQTVGLQLTYNPVNLDDGDTFIFSMSDLTGDITKMVIISSYVSKFEQFSVTNIKFSS
jgi:hypothetical protein